MTKGWAREKERKIERRFESRGAVEWMEWRGGRGGGELWVCEGFMHMPQSHLTA